MSLDYRRVVIAFGALIIGVVFSYVYIKYSALTMRVDMVKKSLDSLKIPQASPACPMVAGTAATWGALQPLIRDAVVQIFVDGAEWNWLEPYKAPAPRQSSGSGFFINEQGDIITNAHVIDQAISITIQIPSFGKRRFSVAAVAISHERDLALLRLEPQECTIVCKMLGRIPALSLGNSDEVHRAEEIMALGYPLGQQSLKSTTGVVSGREHIMGAHMVQISAPINPGSSGGPSLNCKGQVIGVNSAGVSAAQNVGYLIPSNEVKLFLDHVAQLPDQNGIKFLRKPFLGIVSNFGTESLTEFLSNPVPGGLYVAGVQKGSPLDCAGVKEGDMIYEIDGYKIDTFGEITIPWIEDKISIIDYISRLSFGDTVHFVAYRYGVPYEFDVQVGISKLAPVRQMYPGYEKIDYEVLGGLVIMELAINHLPILIQRSPELAAYADVQKQLEGAVIITHILPGSEALKTRSLMPGLVIKEVNGIPVYTLQEVRQALKKSTQSGFLTLKTSQDIFTVMPFKRIIADEQRLSATFHYPLSSCIPHEDKKTS